MKLIPLTQGQFAMVDDEDYDYLMQWKWHASKQKTENYYAIRSEQLHEYIGRKQGKVYIHREVMKILDKKTFIDHEDRNGLNCQKSNLRICTTSQNQMNKLSKKNSTSKYKGVSHQKVKKWQYWQCYIMHENKHTYLGTFPYTHHGEIQAALAYNKAAIKYHGEFANLNIISD